ncbi:DUF7144 family membrane protein [Nocardia miyunensis]|uniref:DUF7144 family membrane protein n=1 Tax=Nocardia miyunensis TaxID=282684 RepID=UPI000AA4F567|nr:hypothetical protein [Nocardia miyunensis]
MSDPIAPVTPQQAPEPEGRHQAHGPSIGRPAAAIGTVAAAALLIVAGVVQILEGISAVEADDIVVVGPQYSYRWSTTGWGVVHIVIGALLVLVAAALLAGQTWARVTAIVFASVSIVANFLWLPHNPWWSILVIALDAFLIWAVATWDRGTAIA